MTAIRLTIPELLDQHPTEVMELSPQQRSFTLEYIAGFFAPWEVLTQGGGQDGVSEYRR